MYSRKLYFTLSDHTSISITHSEKRAGTLLYVVNLFSFRVYKNQICLEGLFEMLVEISAFVLIICLYGTGIRPRLWS